MIKIKCLSDYAGRFRAVRPIAFKAGDEVEVDQDLAEYLSNDAPESFSFPKGFGSGKAPDAPPEDKMMDGKETTRKVLEKASVGELKDLLRSQGLPVGGRKKALIKRLMEGE